MASSGKLVLADIRASAPGALMSDDRSNFRSSLLRSRTQSWGDQKLVENMIPGYTGCYTTVVFIYTRTKVLKRFYMKFR